MRFVEGEALQRKIKKNLCPVYGCRNKRGNKKKCCPKHDRQIFKEKNPLGFKFEGLRESARSRRVRSGNAVRYAFTITRENFIQWAEFHGFGAVAKLTGNTLTVDRKNPNLGYHIWNIKPMRHSENSAKGKKSFMQFYRDKPHLLPEGERPEDYAFLDFTPEEIEVPF